MDMLQAVRLRTGRVAEGVVDALAKPLIENALTLHRSVFLRGAQLMSGLKGSCEVLQVPLPIFHLNGVNVDVINVK